MRWITYKMAVIRVSLNCGYSQGFSVKEVIREVKKVSDTDFPVHIDKRRAGDPAILVSSNEKIKATLGFKPKYNDLELICRTAFNWEKK